LTGFFGPSAGGGGLHPITRVKANNNVQDNRIVMFETP
jgi:hypothetical protein